MTSLCITLCPTSRMHTNEFNTFSYAMDRAARNWPACIMTFRSIHPHKFRREVHFASLTMQQVGVHSMYVGEVNMFLHVLDGGALHWHNCAAGWDS